MSRATAFCSYEIGLIQQSTVFRDGIVHGPIGRSWSGQPGNLFRNDCIFYQEDLAELIDYDRFPVIANVYRDLSKGSRI